ncbi:MAG: radical SAM protein [bacterium]|nr:radical SAM protein [bacterium]
MKRPQKTMILFPPDWNKEEPYYSLPCLTSVLRPDGIEVIQKDLNIDFYDHMLTRAGLTQLLDMRRREFADLERRPFLGAPQQQNYETLAKEVHFLPFLIEEVEECVAILRTKDSMEDRTTFGRAHRNVETAIRAIKRTLDRPGMELASSDDVFAAATTPRPGPWEEYVEAHFLSELRAEAPDIVGLSITAVQQLLPGFTLARYVREACPDAHITVGGDIISIGREVFQGQARWYDLVDSFIYFEGETPFRTLHRVLRDGDPLADVPNCSYLEDGEVQVSVHASMEDVDALPTPDFDGLVWEKYLTSERSLCVTAARGCHWGRCSFCTLSYGIQGVGSVRCRTPKKIVEDIKALKARYGGDHFYVAGNGIPPVFLSEIADALIEQDVEIVWGCEAKIERPMTSDLLGRLSQSGLRRIQYGVESINKRVLNKLMKKGCPMPIVESVIEDTVRVGIAPHVFLMLGFPGETEDEALETWEFARRNRGNVFTLAVSPFNLNKYSEVDTLAEKYGVEIYRHPERDLARSYMYSVAPPAISPQRAIALARAIQLEFNDFSAYPESGLFDFHRGLMFAAIQYEHDPNFLDAQKRARTQQRTQQRTRNGNRPGEPQPVENGRNGHAHGAPGGNGLEGETLLKLPSNIGVRELSFDLRQLHKSVQTTMSEAYGKLGTGRTLKENREEFANRAGLAASPTNVVFDARECFAVYSCKQDAAAILKRLEGQPGTLDAVTASCARDVSERRKVQRVVRGLVKRGMIEVAASE